MAALLWDCVWCGNPPYPFREQKKRGPDYYFLVLCWFIVAIPLQANTLLLPADSSAIVLLLQERSL